MSKKSMKLKTLKAKKSMSEKKNEMKQTRWQAIRELEDRRLGLKEKKAMTYLISEENSTIIMDMSPMDSIPKE
jgi:hypothetical protein